MEVALIVCASLSFVCVGVYFIKSACFPRPGLKVSRSNKDLENLATQESYEEQCA